VVQGDFRFKNASGTQHIVYDASESRINFADNISATFGDANDATVKHDGSSNLQVRFSDASTSVSAQVPPGIRIVNTDTTIGRLSGIYFTNGHETANVGIFGETLDAATASTGQGSNMVFYTKANAQSLMVARAKFTNAGHFVPSTNNTYDLGSSSLKWRNVYTNDLHLSNEGSSNDVDETWGDYTIQEGESDLFLINNRNGKKYKFNLTEVS